MEIKHIELKNFGPFIEKSIDIKDGITAFVGQMGSGKTMSLEAPYATSFMEFATRSKKLSYYARGVSEISTVWEDNGKQIMCSLNIGKESTNGSISIDKKTAYFSTQNTYIKALKPYFGDKNLWLATILCSQTKNGNFVELTKTPRKDIFYQILNLRMYDFITEKASIKRKDAEKLKNELDGKISLIDSQIKEFEADLSKENFQELQKTVFEQKTRLDELTPKVKQFQEYHIIENQLKGVNLELSAINFSNTDESIKKFNVSSANTEIINTNKFIQDSEKTLSDISLLTEELVSITKEADNEKKNNIELKQDITDADIKIMHDNLYKVSTDITNASNVLAALNKEKIDLENKKLYTPPCGDNFKGCLLKQEQTNIHEKLNTLNTKISKEANQSDIDKMIGYKNTLALKITEAEKIKKVIWNLESLRKKYREVKQKVDLLTAQLGESATERRQKISLFQKHIDELHKKVDLSFKYQELLGKYKALTAQKKELTLKISGIPYDSKIEDEFSVLSKTYPDVNDKFIRLSERYNNVTLLKEQRVSVESNLNIVNKEVSEYLIIEDMCGYNGIPSIEIDSAIPEIENIATTLLNEANWNYKVRLETQKDGSQKEKSKYKILETLEVLVIDGNDSLLKSVEDLSVGQKSIIGEAISLALTILAKRNKVISIDTLFRDETTANLNKEAAANYITLLRNAMLIGGFKNVIYVTHQEFLLSQVDHIVSF